MGVTPARFYVRSRFKNHRTALTESYLLVLKQLCFPQKHPAENLVKIRGWTSLLRGGIDATAHALRVVDVYTVYSAQPIYTLSHAIANSGKVKKLRIGK